MEIVSGNREPSTGCGFVGSQPVLIPVYGLRTASNGSRMPGAIGRTQKSAR